MCTKPYTQVTPVKQLLIYVIYIQTVSVCSSKAQTAFVQQILRATVTFWVVSTAQSLPAQDPNGFGTIHHPDRQDIITVDG